MRKPCSVTAQFAGIATLCAGLLRHVLVLSILALYVSGCSWLDVKQRLAIYRPTQGVPPDFAGLRAGDERFFASLPRATLGHRYAA